jgi:hypothetical protein
MRSLVCLGFATACASSTIDPAPPPASLRDRIDAGPIRLALSSTASAGSIVAREKSGGGWSTGTVELSVTGGALAMEARVIDTATVDFAPIPIPASVIAGDASLSGIRLRVPAPEPIELAWQGDDAATATTQLDLVLDWSLSANGGAFALGPQTLTSVSVTLTLGGDGETMTATIDVTQSGMVWMWAGVIELDNLALRLGAKG